MGNNTTIINCLTAKFRALWIAQSKDTFLPQFVYNLCKEYMKTPSDEIKRFKPVEIVGKQPDDDVWVFNSKIQMDRTGRLIPEEERVYVSMEASDLPYLHTIKSDFDNGEALKKLIIAEKALFQNNYPQVILAHAASSMAANYDTIVEQFDGCAMPILRGLPVSGKTTALRAVMSTFGIRQFSSESSSRYIETQQSRTTIPFGWDDASSIKILKNVAVNSYNGCGSSTMKTSLRPHTVPIVTTNLETSEEKVNSRWLRIGFESLTPRLVGKDKVNAEINLKKAMNEAYKSIAVVTIDIHNALKRCTEDDSYFQILEEVEGEVEEMPMPVDQRVKLMVGVILFCTKKILEKVDLADDYRLVWDKMKTVILPSYVMQPVGLARSSIQVSKTNEDLVENILHEQFLKLILQTDANSVTTFFDNDYNPSKCMCGSCIVFHVNSAVTFLRDNLPESVMGSVNDNSVRAFIKKRKIGCLKVQITFRRRPKQCNAAHIQKSWFKEEDIVALDEKLGKRKGHKTNACTTTEANHPTDQSQEQSGADLPTPDQSQEQSGADLPTPDQSQEQSGADLPTSDQSQEQSGADLPMSDQSQKQSGADFPTPDQSQKQSGADLTTGERGRKVALKSGNKRKGPVDCLFDKLHGGLVEGKRTRKPK